MMSLVAAAMALSFTEIVMQPGAAISGFCVPSMRMPRLLKPAMVPTVSPTCQPVPVQLVHVLRCT